MSIELLTMKLRVIKKQQTSQNLKVLLITFREISRNFTLKFLVMKDAGHAS